MLSVYRDLYESNQIRTKKSKVSFNEDTKGDAQCSEVSKNRTPGKKEGTKEDLLKSQDRECATID